MSNALLKHKSQRLAGVGGVGIRTQLLELAATLPDVIAMGRGDPDLATPQHIVDAGKAALDNYLRNASLPLREKAAQTILPL